MVLHCQHTIQIGQKPIEPLRAAIAKQFPLLAFSLQNTAQLQEFFHHLPSRFWTFIYTDTDFLEPLGDFLVEKNHNVLVNPAGGETVKYSSFKKEILTVLRPEITYRGEESEYFKSIKRFWSTCLNSCRKLLDYAQNRNVKPSLEKLIRDIIDINESG
jgi:hypothetical protein